MDLNKLDVKAASEVAAFLHLENPDSSQGMLYSDDGGKAIGINLLGHDSKAWRSAVAAAAAKSVGKKQLSEEAALQVAAEALAAVTVGWSGIFVGGGEYEFSFESAVALYLKYPWIREQVDAFVGDRAAFLKNAARK
jgi:hypothetical protein